MKSTSKYKLIIQPQGIELDVASGLTILDALRTAGISISAACNSKGNCGQCRVIVQKGQTGPPSDSELKILSKKEISQGERLACRTTVNDNITIHISPSKFLNEAELQFESRDFNGKIAPLITSHFIKLSPPSLEDPRSDFTRLIEKLPRNKNQYFADLAVLNQLANKAREYHWEINLLLRKNEIIGILPPQSTALGIAIDLGTTKIAASLQDLSTGKEIAKGAITNPQIQFGEDLISRLEYAIQNAQKAQQITQVIRKAINQLIQNLITQAGLRSSQIADIVIVGNTAMIHLLCALPVAQLASSPFVAATSESIEIKAKDLELEAAPGAYIYIPPNIGGFIGSDHVAMILADKIDKAHETTIGIDIGTNTEILLKHTSDYMENASCASGPAFEGYHISCGLRAITGAISAAKLTPEGFQFTTIKNAPAIGICGTGIIDIIAELRRNNIINQSGRIDPQHSCTKQENDQLKIILIEKSQNGNKKDIFLTQEDINQIQLAKGAIRAGIEILIDSADIDYGQVKNVILAGAFGSYINIKNALAIGLIPYFPRARYFQSGNAALSGAKAILLSQDMRQRINKIISMASFMELSSNKNFNHNFAMGMFFQEEDLTKADHSNIQLEDISYFINS